MTNYATFFDQKQIASSSAQEIHRAVLENQLLIQDGIHASESKRTLDRTVVAALKSSGVFRMAVPRELGGLEVPVIDQALLIEHLSGLYGSAGWCAMIGSDGGYYTAAKSNEIYRSIYSSPDQVTAGWIVPAGTLRPTQGGFLLNGEWSFGSGIRHADIVVGGAIVQRESIPSETSVPEIRVAMVPQDKVTIQTDSWRTLGLKGTGSCNYSASDVFVPETSTFTFKELQFSRRDARIYGWPGMFFANLAAVPLGICGTACNEATKILRDKLSNTQQNSAPMVRESLSSAISEFLQVRNMYYSTLSLLIDTLNEEKQPSLFLRGQLASSYRAAISAPNRIISNLIDSIGTLGVREECGLERALRDTKTISQHLMGQQKMDYVSGSFFLGQTEFISRHPLAAAGII